MADGLSTGVFILGPERGMALVERLPDVEAVIVTADNQVLVSSGLRSDVSIGRPPTRTRGSSSRPGKYLQRNDAC